MIIYRIKHLKETIILLPIKLEYGNIGIVNKGSKVVIKTDHSPPSTISNKMENDNFKIENNSLYKEIISKLKRDQEQVLIEMIFEGEVRK